MTISFAASFAVFIGAALACARAFHWLVRAAYFMVWFVAFVVAGVAEISSEAFAVFQYVLAFVMLSHARHRTIRHAKTKA